MIFWPNRFLISRVNFWSKNWFCHFSTKNRFENSRDHILPILVKIFDQNSIFDLQIQFLVENLNFLYFDKNRFEIFSDHFWANFSRKIELSIFWPKIDFWPPGSIFGRKFEFFIFRLKLDLGPPGNIFGPILVEKLNFWFFDQKLIFDLQGPFLVQKLSF